MSPATASNTTKVGCLVEIQPVTLLPITLDEYVDVWGTPLRIARRACQQVMSSFRTDWTWTNALASLWRTRPVNPGKKRTSSTTILQALRSRPIRNETPCHANVGSRAITNNKGLLDEAIRDGITGLLIIIPDYQYYGEFYLGSQQCGMDRRRPFSRIWLRASWGV